MSNIYFNILDGAAFLQSARAALALCVSNLIFKILGCKVNILRRIKGDGIATERRKKAPILEKKSVGSCNSILRLDGVHGALSPKLFALQVYSRATTGLPSPSV